MKSWLERRFPHWFVFGGYSDPGFKHTSLYDPNAPCDVSDGEQDVFEHISYPAAEKLIAARQLFIDTVEKIAEEHPEVMERR